ncbi:hypothetical protein ACQV5M_13140 [Leptospira sp. SA-E8]|uniref:hypothetical protein n=1 Tax=Leptospira sp. SA-E8 TaxID=3422259 RepID=UPI003EBCBBBE
MKSKITLLILLIFSNCYGNIFYWKRLPYYPIQNSEGNYLKLYLPSELRNSGEKIQIESYLIHIFQEEKDTVLKRRLLINNDRKLGFNTLWTGLKQFHFKTDCQLILPISKGEYTYEIKANKYPDGFFSNLLITQNLKENQSIVLSFYIIEPPYSKPNGISQELANRIQNRVKLKYEVEPTSNEDKSHDCPYE